MLWKRAGRLSEGKIQGGERERRGATDTIMLPVLWGP